MLWEGIFMRILFITRFDFLSDKRDGGLLGTYRNYTLLEQIYGKENIQLCIVSSNKNHDCKDCKSVRYFFHPANIIYRYLMYLCLKDRISPKVEQEIIECINQFAPDLIFYDGSTFGQIVKKLYPIKKQVVYFHNIERHYTWEQVKKYNCLCIFRYFATRYNENKMVRNIKNRICVNERDAALLEKLYHKKCNFILPATFEDTYSQCALKETIMDNVPNEKLNLLFVGSYFVHNYKGLLWFINEVLPSINVRLTVVGKGMEKLQKKIHGAIGDKIVIEGTVENLEEYYVAADAVVMPIFMGGGIKVKTAEALMYGKTVFASTEALLGYDVHDVENIYICNTKEQYINQIQRYMEGKNRIKYNRDIRDLFLRKYCTKNYLKKFKTYLETIN